MGDFGAVKPVPDCPKVKLLRDGLVVGYRLGFHMKITYSEARLPNRAPWRLYHRGRDGFGRSLLVHSSSGFPARECAYAGIIRRTLSSSSERRERKCI